VKNETKEPKLHRQAAEKPCPTVLEIIKTPRTHIMDD